MQRTLLKAALQAVSREAVQASKTLCFVSQVMQDAVTEAVQAAVDEGMKFDVRANLYTIIAITGQIASLTLCGCRWRMSSIILKGSCISRIVHSE